MALRVWIRKAPFKGRRPLIHRHFRFALRAVPRRAAMEGTAVIALQGLLLKAFGRPSGILGNIGGLIMARANRPCATWVVGLLDELLAHAASGGCVFGIDASREMLDQARVRNANAILSGHVDLRLGAAEALPFRVGSFDRAMAINSLQIWTDADAGVRELHE